MRGTVWRPGRAQRRVLLASAQRDPAVGKTLDGRAVPHEAIGLTGRKRFPRCKMHRAVPGPGARHRPGERGVRLSQSAALQIFKERLGQRAAKEPHAVLALGKAGAKICVNDISEEKLESCKKDYADDGIDVYTLKFDVTDEKDVDRGITQIENEVGTIDILVNNAGIIKRIPILDMSVADYKQVIDVDLVAPLIVSKRVAPKMIEKR